jgi:hypothetical protein
MAGVWRLAAPVCAVCGLKAEVEKADLGVVVALLVIAVKLPFGSVEVLVTVVSTMTGASGVVSLKPASVCIKVVLFSVQGTVVTGICSAVTMGRGKVDHVPETVAWVVA